MTPSWRKPAGAFAIIALITLWCVLIASLQPITGEWHIVLQLMFYALTGLIWIMPLKPLLLWMETGLWRVPKG